MKIKSSNNALLDAYWQDDGKRLLAKIFPGIDIHSCIGIVKRKNDDRYEWFVKIPKTNFFNTPDLSHGIQGVCDKKSEAKQRLLDIWRIEETE